MPAGRMVAWRPTALLLCCALVGPAATAEEEVCTTSRSGGSCNADRGRAGGQRAPALLQVTAVRQEQQEEDRSPRECADADKLRFATWNIQNFGVTKAHRPDVMRALATIIAQYDVVAIQELSEMPWDEEPCGRYTASAICSLLDEVNDVVNSRWVPEFSLAVSPRTGHEQYALLYKFNRVTVTSSGQYPDEEQQHSRPPYVFLIEEKISGKRIAIASAHVRPHQAVRELNDYPNVAAWMEREFPADANILAGDFNADGSYFKEEQCWGPVMGRMGGRPGEYCLLTGNDLDTTVANSSNTYDRIIASSNLAATPPSVLVPENTSYFAGVLEPVMLVGCTQGYVKSKYCKNGWNYASSMERAGAMQALSDHYPVELEICMATTTQSTPCRYPASSGDLCTPRALEHSPAAPSSLQAGDCEVVAFQTVNPDDFAVVLLKDIGEGEAVFVTDKGVWNGVLSDNEGVLSYRAPENMPAGTVLRRSNFEKSGGRFALRATSDQLIVFAGSVKEPTYLCAFTTAGPWEPRFGQESLRSTKSSEMPEGVWPGKGANSFGEKKNGYYTGATIGALTHLRSEILNESNWEFSRQVIADNIVASFTVNADEA